PSPIRSRRFQMIHVLSATAAALSSPTREQTPKPDDTGTDALLFKDDPQFWFETTRLFGAAEYGGALFGEGMAISRRIKSGDYDSWYEGNNAFADRLSSEADAQMKKGHHVSARDNYLRAC